jgi:predicted Zn finger-like uncharacterized protein
MYLRTVCPSCREEYELTPQQRGHKVRCPECDTLFAPEVEEIAEQDDAEREATPARKHRKRRNRPQRIRQRVQFSHWPVLAVIGLCGLSVLVAGAALLIYVLRRP